MGLRRARWGGRKAVGGKVRGMGEVAQPRGDPEREEVEGRVSGRERRQRGRSLEEDREEQTSGEAAGRGEGKGEDRKSPGGRGTEEEVSKRSQRRWGRRRETDLPEPSGRDQSRWDLWDLAPGRLGVGRRR